MYGIRGNAQQRVDFGFTRETLHLPQIVRGGTWQLCGRTLEADLVKYHGKDLVFKAFFQDHETAEQDIINPPCPLESFLEPCEKRSRPRAVLEHYFLKTSPVLELVKPFPPSKNILPDMLNDPEKSSLSFIATGKGFYTKAHVDFTGTVGWMALLRGQKQWSFWNPHGPNKEAFLAALKTGGEMPKPDITFVANAGDLVIVPAGYGHAVSTTMHSVGIGGSCFIAEQSLAGLGVALKADVIARSLSVQDGKKEVNRQRRGIAAVLGVSLWQLSEKEAAVASEAAAAGGSDSAVKASRLYQHVHAPKRRRGKRKKTSFSQHKREHVKSCTHPEHVPGKSRLLNKRGIRGLWHGEEVIMCDLCYKAFKKQETLHSIVKPG
jgi:hypothetical protein